MELYTYLIKSAFALSVFYIVYWAFLKKETFFRFNRVYFISTIFLVGMLPLVNLGFKGIAETGSPARVINTGYHYIQDAILVNRSEDQITVGSQFNIRDFILIVYWTGVVLFSLRFFYQTGYILLLIKRSCVKHIDGVKIIPNGRFSVPFSFFSYVFLPNHLFVESNAKAIVAHEKEHIKQGHWADLFLLEIVSIFQWFNPFVWFYRWSLKEVHEFLADQGTIRQGISKPVYIGLLMEYVLGTPGIGLTHSFNYSLSKKRIQMMNKEKSPNRRKLRIFILFPVIIILSMAFSTSVQDVSSSLLGTLDNQESGIKVEGKIIAKDTGLPLEGVHIIIQGTTKGTTSDAQGKFQIDVSDKKDVLVISYVGYETIALLIEKGNYDEVKMERTSYEMTLEEDADVDVSIDVVVDIEGVEEAIEAIEVEVEDAIEEVEVEVEDAIEEGEVEEVEVEVDEEADIEVDVEDVQEVESDVKIFYVVEDLPSFPGGKAALARYIAKNIKYPEDAIKAGKSGTVYVTIRLNEKGEVEEAKVKKSLYPSLDKEAIRVVKSMPKWNPGKQDGIPVSCDIDLPIEFKLK